MSHIYVYAMRGENFPYVFNDLPSTQNMLLMLKRPVDRPSAEVLDQIRNLKIDPGLVISRVYPDDHDNADALTKTIWDIEMVRMRSSIGGRQSPMDFWTRANPRVFDGLTCAEDKRELVFRKTGQCNTFNPTFARTLVNRFAANESRVRSGRQIGDTIRVLDPSSGWGDRLVGTYLAGLDQQRDNDNHVTYHGFDPNGSLKKGYEQLFNVLNQDDINEQCGSADERVFGAVVPVTDLHERMERNESTICIMPFEDVDERRIRNRFDMVLTSPPFGALEKYDAGKFQADQSIEKYKSQNEWNAFYRGYLQKSWSALRAGGNMAIYVGNSGKIRTEDTTKRLMEEITGNTHSDVFHFVQDVTWTISGYKIKPRPAWVWAKPGG